MVRIPVRLVVETWERRVGGPIPDDALFELTSGNWHGGTTFRGVMTMSEDDAMELSEAAALGAVPVVFVYAEGERSNEPSM